MELNVDMRKDFFESAGFLKYEPVFSKLTSDEMWAVYLFTDVESPKYPLREEQRILEIKKHYLKDEGYDWKKLSEAIKAYPEMFLTKIERELKSFLDMVDKRHAMMEKVPYDLKNAKELDRMLVETKVIMESVDKLQKLFEKQKIKTRVKGNQSESFLDKLG